MLYYLDSVIVIYAVEGSANQPRTLNHLMRLEQAGHRFAISDLTRTECLIPTLGPGVEQRLSDFVRFFRGPNIRVVSLTAATYDRAAAIRGAHSYPSAGPSRPKAFGLADSLHLAAAIESGCDVFLTNDNHLSGFPDILVEILP